MQLQLPLKHQTQPRALHVPTYVTGTIQVLPNPVQFIHTPKRNAMLRQLQRANGCRANTATGQFARLLFARVLLRRNTDDILLIAQHLAFAFAFAFLNYVYIYTYGRPPTFLTANFLPCIMT